MTWVSRLVYSKDFRSQHVFNQGNQQFHLSHWKAAYQRAASSTEHRLLFWGNDRRGRNWSFLPSRWSWIHSWGHQHHRSSTSGHHPCWDPADSLPPQERRTGLLRAHRLLIKVWLLSLELESPHHRMATSMLRRLPLWGKKHWDHNSWNQADLARK